MELLLCFALLKTSDDADAFGILCGAVAVIAVLFMMALKRISGGTDEVKYDSPPQEVTAKSRTRDSRDDIIDESLREQHSDLVDYSFHCKLAGVTHDNSDGTSRDRIIRRCKIGEPLELRPDPLNPVDPNAIAVHRLLGRRGQIGYLPAATAAEYVARITEEPGRYIGWFVRLVRRVNPSVIVGAMIVVGRLKEPVDLEAGKRSAKAVK
jgi:hypothetical protein